MRSLVALGVSGGLIPCPAALVLLLSAISLDRTGLGIVLVVAFSVGLAVVLTGIGLLMIYARHVFERFSFEATSAKLPAHRQRRHRLAGWPRDTAGRPRADRGLLGRSGRVEAERA